MRYGEERELPGRELDAAAVDVRLAGQEVERHRPDRERRGRPAVLRRTPGAGPDPRQKLGERERLPEVVGGAEVEPAHAIGDIAAGRQHDDRQVGVGSADRAQHLETVHARQHHVEDHEVSRALAQAGERILAPTRRVDGVPLSLQPTAQEVRDQDFVLDDQDVHLALSVASLTGQKSPPVPVSADHPVPASGPGLIAAVGNPLVGG